jgi:hypothetical protein
VTRFQDRVPYVNMKGIEFMLKAIELRDPRADSSFIQELEKTGFVDSVDAAP